MSRSQKKASVKPAEPKNNDSVVNQYHGIDKQLTNTDRARNDELRKSTMRNKHFQRIQRRKAAIANTVRQDEVRNFTHVNQSVKQKLHDGNDYKMNTGSTSISKTTSAYPS